MKLPKPKSKRKQGQEWMYECPRCGVGKANKAPYEINIRTGKAHCFHCGLNNNIDINTIKLKAADKIWNDEHKELPPTEDVPDNLKRIFMERGMQFRYTIHRYNIRWDGGRLCWPVGKGFWRRSIYSSDEPKVKMDTNAHGILGEPLMKEHMYIVLTEGDWKAAAVPQPWVGVGLGGTDLSRRQEDIIVYHKPRLIIVALDGGKAEERVKIIKQLGKRYIQCVEWKLPLDMGPDDVPTTRRIYELTEISC